MKELTTTKTMREIKPLRHCELTEAEKEEERCIVKEAEQRVYDAWSFGPSDLSYNSAEAKAWREQPQARGYTHPLAKAQKLAREAAREDFRADVARKRAEAASLRVDLPSHISRLPHGSLKTT